MLSRYGTDENGELIKKAIVYTKSEHFITKDKIDPDALQIINRLHDLGFIAYIVGGAVRDLIIGNTPKDFDIVKAVIDKNAHKILEQVKYEKQNYKQYIEQEIQDIDAKNLNFIDLGYSGTAQYYLSLLLNKKVAGKYFAVSESLKPLGIGCDVDSCYNSNIYDLEEISKNPMYNCSILLEAFLTAPHGQLQYFEKTTNGNVKPIFNFENNLEKVDAFEKIYNAIIEYIDDMFEIFGEDILKLNIDRKIFIDLYRSFIYDSFKMNNDMKYLFDIDDYYCSNGVINGVDIWKSIL